MAGIFPAIIFIAMSRFHSYINSAVKIIKSYKGDIPFAFFLKKFFAAEKKYGSKDRRQIGSLCYMYFRLGHAFPAALMPEKIITAVFLCSDQHSPLLDTMQPEWNKNMQLPLKEKLLILKNDFTLQQIFPFANELSEGVDAEQYAASFLIQPDLFLRMRPGYKNSVIEKLETTAWTYSLPAPDCIQLPAGTKADSIFLPDREAVVQDYNSQKVLDYLKAHKDFFKKLQRISVWDCCAASGGKSILFNDIIDVAFDLTVSDIRQSIIDNLHQRFATAGIKNYTAFTANLYDDKRKQKEDKYDVIICDAPCTGSGTWSRTPEQLCFFKAAAINEYSSRQKMIVSSLIPQLNKGGLLFYITCSVFKKENESVVEFIMQTHGLLLLETTFLTGYDKKADSMFTAVFTTTADAD